jgi:hypothetical protein
VGGVQIGKVASQTGINIDAIHFYERGGLPAKPARSEGGYRLYHQQDIHHLKFIRRTQALAGVYKLSESFWGKPFLVNGLGVGAWYDLTGCRDELLEVVAADLFRGEARHV